MSFAGKKALVTGGARGIGRAIAEALMAGGATVAIGARSEASFDAFAAAHTGQSFVPAIGELHDRASCAAVVAAATTGLGGLDILVNSAGYFEEAPVREVTEDHWNKTMSVNVAGVFFTSQAALAHLPQGGVIVNLGSDAGLIGFPLGAVYSASKGAVVNLTRAMALELAPDVRVNCVCPGYVDTEMVETAAKQSEDPEDYLKQAHARAPMGRMARPAEVARAVLFLASEENPMINGAILSVDGGGVCGF